MRGMRVEGMCLFGMRGEGWREGLRKMIVVVKPMVFLPLET